MAKDRTGYIFEENGKWFARITITDKTGKRRNIKRTAKTKSEAKEKLKQLNHQIEDEGEKTVSISKLTFNDLADYYESHYAKEAVSLITAKLKECGI
jgi:hypothetical protein